MNEHMFPEEYLSPAVSAHYFYTYREIETWLERTTYPSGKQRPFKKITFELTEEQLIVARSRGVKTNDRPSNKNQSANSSGRGNVRWINVSLSDDDAAFLTETSTGFSELAAMACEYVARGYSLTIKPMDGGDSVMACIVGSASGNPDVSVGLSGFAANVRDALLVLCYKFEDKLGGELPLPDEPTSTGRPRFR